MPAFVVVRQVARRARVERGKEQERAGLIGCDQLARQFAREVKAGTEVDGMHLLPGLVAHSQGVIGLAPRRRRAMDKVRHAPNGCLCGSQQFVAHLAPGEVADERKPQLRPGCGFDRRRDRILADVGKYRPHALADQGLRDRTADAVSSPRHQRRLARRIE